MDARSPLGDKFDGVWTCDVVVPQYTQEGTWAVEQVTLRDFIENVSVYSTQDLQALGLPTDLTVGFITGTPATSLSSPTNGKRVRGNSLTIKAELAQGSPDDVSPTLGVRFDFRALPSGVFSRAPGEKRQPPQPGHNLSVILPTGSWVVSGVAAGDYALRAVAHDLSDVPDPTPETITVTIDHVGVV